MADVEKKVVNDSAFTEEEMQEAFGTTDKSEMDDWEKEMNTVNSTSLMIAYERYLETQREDALFKDPLAEHLMGISGKQLSTTFEKNGIHFGFGDWSDFHRMWTAVRTKFIDDWLEAGCERLGKDVQIVNLGAGVDSRGYRLDFIQPDMTIFEVDMKKTNDVKLKRLSQLDFQPKCTIHTLSCDITTDELEKKLEGAGFSSEKPTLWLAEGLVMYFNSLELQVGLMQRIIAMSGPNSEACVNFMINEDYPQAPGMEDVKSAFAGWHNVDIYSYGQPELNFGRYQGSEPFNVGFSFAVATQADIST